MNPLIDEKRDEIVDLCRQYRVRALELFGSAVSNRFDPTTSDIDFLVDYEALPPREHAACLLRPPVLPATCSRDRTSRGLMPSPA